MATMSEIISTAQRCVGEPIRDASSVGYLAYVPYSSSKPHGASTEIRAGSRQQMLAYLRAKKARVALALAAEEYGISGEAWEDDCSTLDEQLVFCFAGDRYYIDDWRGAVRALVRKHRDGRSVRVVNELGLSVIRYALMGAAKAWQDQPPTDEAVAAYAREVEACPMHEAPQFEISAADSITGRPQVFRLKATDFDVRPAA